MINSIENMIQNQWFGLIVTLLALLIVLFYIKKSKTR